MKDLKIIFLTQFLDWIFDIPDLYADCSGTANECQAIGAHLVHTFNKFVNATTEVICHDQHVLWLVHYHLKIRTHFNVPYRDQGLIL